MSQGGLRRSGLSLRWQSARVACARCGWPIGAQRLLTDYECSNCQLPSHTSMVQHWNDNAHLASEIGRGLTIVRRLASLVPYLTHPSLALRRQSLCAAKHLIARARVLVAVRAASLCLAAVAVSCLPSLTSLGGRLWDRRWPCRLGRRRLRLDRSRARRRRFTIPPCPRRPADSLIHLPAVRSCSKVCAVCPST